MNFTAIERLVQVVYYTGAGATMLGLTIRFFYRLFRDRDRKDTFIDQMESVHLPNIYSALSQIANKMEIPIEYPHPTL